MYANRSKENSHSNISIQMWEIIQKLVVQTVNFSYALLFSKQTTHLLCRLINTL